MVCNPLFDGLSNRPSKTLSRDKLWGAPPCIFTTMIQKERFVWDFGRLWEVNFDD